MHLITVVCALEKSSVASVSQGCQVLTIRSLGLNSGVSRTPLKQTGLNLQQPDDLRTSFAAAQGDDVTPDALVQKSPLILVGLRAS